MQIKKIHIDAFGGLRDAEFELKKGLNIIEGANESGKSSLAMFIKFAFYGLSGRGLGGAVSERRRYVNWETGSAQGYLVIECGGRDYRVSRELYVSGDEENEAFREKVAVTLEETGEKVFAGEVPGEALLRMPETMFCNSVFVRQIGDIAIDGTGMNEAIENILYSGDEQLSTRRALEKLDKSRKVLLHKNGNGGLIYEKRREIARLTENLASAREKNALVIDLEEQIADSTRLINTREREAAKVTELLSAADKIKALEKLADIETLEEEAEKLEALIASNPKPAEVEADAEELRKISLRRSDTEMRLKSIRMNITALESTLPPQMTDEEKEKDRADVRAAEKAESAKKTCLAVSVITMILAVFSGFAAFFMRTVDMNITYVAAAAGAVMLILSIVFLVLDIRAISRLNRLLLKWNAVDTVDINRAVESKIEENHMLHCENSEIFRLRVEEEKSEITRSEIIASQRILSQKYTEDEPDTDIMSEKALAKTADILHDIASYNVELRTVRGKLSVMGKPSPDERRVIRNEATAVFESELGEKAANITRDERVKAERDRGFYLSTAQAQRTKHTDLEKRLAAMSADFVSPADISYKLDAASAELSRMEKRLSAITGAMKAITAASENLRRSLMPRVVSEAGALLGAFTEGRHSGIGVDSDFTVTYAPGGYTRDADFMSQGTRDASYISLRSALMRVLFAGDPPPQVFDESFARIDARRLEKLLEVLGSDPKNQSLVFTCRALECEKAPEDANCIKL